MYRRRELWELQKITFAKNAVEISEDRVLKVFADNLELQKEDIVENIVEEFEFIKQTKKFINSALLDTLLEG